MTDPRHTGHALLPRSSPDIQRLVSLVSAEFRDQIPWEDLRTFFEPFRCPARLLAWLATVYSVDIWFESWPEQKKREVIARSVELHRLKGTLAGIEEYLDLVDCAVPQAITPPGLFFLSDFDDGHYQAWLETLPEVRVYHWAEASESDMAGGLADAPEDLPEGTELVDALEWYLADIDEIDDVEIPGAFCLMIEPAEVRTGLRAVMIEDGVETELEIESENEFGARQEVDGLVERLFFPETEQGGFYLSSGAEDDDTDTTFVDDGYLQDGTDRRYAAFIRRGGQRISEIGAPTIRGREVVDDDPVRVFTSAADEAVWYLDDPESLWILSSDIDRAYTYYDSWRVVDPRKGSTEAPAWSFLDHDRFSIPAYHAELVIDLPETAPIDAWFLDSGPIGFLVDHSYEQLWNACDVVVVASSERDQVLLDLDYGRGRTLRQITQFSDLILR